MPREEQPIPTKISTKQMKETIQRSGYLLEQRVASILRNTGYYVETNPAFPDPDTGKSRECDIFAITLLNLYREGFDAIYPCLICECENNAQPMVFFAQESPVSSTYHWEVKASGIPVKFWQKDVFVSLPDFANMGKFHHYCREPVATQYCNFQLKKDKSRWIATHNVEQHSTFDSLIKYVEYEIANSFDGWLPSDEWVNVTIYYPLVILQGSLYMASLINDSLTLKKSKHIQFRKEFFLPRRRVPETYQIDVITEEYLPEYLRLINTETRKIKTAFKRKKETVLTSIEKIVEEAKQLKKQPKSYRECLEF